MGDNARLRKWVLQTLKFHGFSIRADAADYLTDQLLILPQDSRISVLENLTDQLRMVNSDTLAVDKQQIEICFRESLLEKPSSETVWNVIDAFQCPRFIFNRELCKYEMDKTVTKKGLFADASSKSFMRRRLYTNIMQRTLRQDAIKQVFEVNGKKFQYVVKTVEWFLCATDKIEHAVIIGLLVRKPDGGYAVEDTTGTLDIDISQTKFADGLFPEHSFVFLEGIYEDRVFYVLRFGLPPAETSMAARPYYDEMNTFGGSSQYNLKNSKVLKNIEEKNQDEMIVFISDVWLDNDKVLKQLDKLFSGFSEFPPYAFVLMGNFLSSQKVATYAQDLKQGFTELGNIVAHYENIRNKSHFVFVPGPFDIGSPRILPRPPLSKYLVSDFIAKVQNVTLATNPCRIQYCTREIVVIREDLVTKLCRNTIHFPNNAADRISFHFVKTILSQGTLAPMSLLVCPVYWNFSHALDLNPLPDLVVASDQFNSFTEKYMDCTVISPGLFVKEKFSFKVYVPFRNEVEDSCIPEEI
ncbi:hypothetical protein RUM43_007754 [Polyplax serrata]|uniref:DNA polymerase epsilon subunit n=1 Tax=Polyplax serrata TaxID=468196 RepID=A0AAN8SA87_POLSC